MSGHTKWSELKHKGAPTDKDREAVEKEYNRFYWRLVRFWDRLRGR